MHAIIKDGKILLYDSYIFKESIKEISGRQWHPEEKAWSVPILQQNIETLDLFGCELSDELTDIRQSFVSKNTANENTLLPAPLKISPYEHQLKGYNLACLSMGIIGNNGVSPGFALLMEMGTGKNITSIVIVGKAYLTGKINRLIILAPKSIIAVWEDEFSKFADFPYSLSVLTGTSAKKTEQLKTIPHKGLEVAVVNYDSVPLIEKELTAWYHDFLICDESSKIKNPTAKMSKATYRVAKVCKYRLILTGTPIQNNPLDFFSQYKTLDDSIFGKSFYAFKNEYAVLGAYNQPIGWRKLPELVKKAHSIAFRVTKAEALDLPDTIDEIRSIALEDKAQKLYKSFVKESHMELSKCEQGAPVAVTATNILTRLLRLQQITGGFIHPDEESERYEQISSAKLNALEDIIDTAISENKKLVVIARFIPEIKEICKMLDKKKVKYAHICGEVKDRAAEVDAFQNNPECMVFVGQLQTVSMGLTLTAASTMVFYSLSYNFADYSQARARIHRIGQKNNCLYIHLVVKNTVDETVLKALDEKCGYYGEKVVLYAQALGLNTCWVALTYKKVKNAFKISDGEKLCLVISIGYGSTQGIPHKSKPESEAFDLAENAPEWFERGIDAALLAPTAVNQQKFKFSLSGNNVSVKAGLATYSRVDLGIVKYHFELGAGKENFNWVN